MPTVVSPTGLLPVVFDPADPDALDINDGVGYVVHADLSMPPPAQKPQYASSVDTEGSIPVPDSAHYENREIGVKVRVYGDSDAQVEDRLAALYRRLGRVHRQGGVLGVTTPAGRTIFFDLVGEADAETTFDDRWLRLNKTDVEIRLSAAPFWRGEEVAMGSFTETAENALVFTVHDVPGDVPALGRLVVKDLSGVDQWTVVVGVQARHWSPNPEAGLLLDAEDLTPVGTSILFGSSVLNSDLPTFYTAVLKSTLSLAQTPLEHKGSFQVWANIQRPTANTGAISVALEWGEGDYHVRSANPPVEFDVGEREGLDVWSNLGTVHLSGDTWEFRLLVKSTVAGDDIAVKDFMLVPTDDGHITLSGRALFEVATTLSVRDEFDQSSGNLTGKTLPVGGTWGAGSGDADDFTVDSTLHRAVRSTLADDFVSVGRTALAGSTTFTDVTVTGLFAYSIPAVDFPVYRPVQTLVARWVDQNNWLGLFCFTSESQLALYRVSTSSSGTFVGQRLALAQIPGGFPSNVFYGVRMQVSAAGAVRAWYWTTSTPSPIPILSAQHADLATGGALASGRVGISDYFVGPTSASTRSYDYFSAFVPTYDAAIFANRSLELTHRSARRLSVDGAMAADVADRKGRYLRLQPGTNRLVVKGFRNDPETGTNNNVDDIQADLYATPRGLVVPAG